MSDPELEAIKRKKLQEMQRRLAEKQKKEEEVNPDKVLNALFKGRAWDVFNSASSQHPYVMRKVKYALVKLALSERIDEITGYQLYRFLQNLGIDVKLNTKIRFSEKGKLKSITEKIKEDLRKD
ncbi:MAG: DNA-binding protein [Thermoproteota archaeon]